jgi:hypothetical protein
MSSSQTKPESRPFRVWSQVTRIDDSHFLCTVAAVPQKPGSADSESEIRVLPDYQLALECCAEMVRAMSNRIERRGDVVVETRMDAPRQG